MNAPIADDPFSDHPLLGIEEPLRALDTAASLLGHLAVSERTIEGNALDAISAMVDTAHDAIKRHWHAAREQQRADKAAHAAALEAAAAALAAAQAERGAPGSVDDIKRAQAMWNVLRALANAALDACDEAIPAEEQEARAAEGVALPPGAGMR
jgi:hypothetical protein